MMSLLTALSMVKQPSCSGISNRSKTTRRAAAMFSLLRTPDARACEKDGIVVVAQVGK